MDGRVKETEAKRAGDGPDGEALPEVQVSEQATWTPMVEFKVSGS